MVYSCEFNPLRDIEATVPELSIDVAESMASGVVASTGTLCPYTKEDDVSQVGHYLRDKIQTVLAARRLDASMAAAAARSSAVPSSAPSPSPSSQPAGE